VNLAELEKRMPFAATVTWAEFAELAAEADSISVDFVAIAASAASKRAAVIAKARAKNPDLDENFREITKLLRRLRRTESDAYVGRGMHIKKEDVIKQAKQHAAWNPGERVTVWALNGLLNFGGR
jgi:hypothetical protein